MGAVPIMMALTLAAKAAESKANQSKAQAAEDARKRQIAEQYQLQSQANDDSQHAVTELDPNASATSASEAANGGAQAAISNATAAQAAAGGAGAGAAGDAAGTGAARQADLRSQLASLGPSRANTQSKLDKWGRSRSRLKQIADERAQLYQAEVERAASRAGGNWDTTSNVLNLGAMGTGLYGQYGGGPTPAAAPAGSEAADYEGLGTGSSPYDYGYVKGR